MGQFGARAVLPFSPSCGRPGRPTAPPTSPPASNSASALRPVWCSPGGWAFDRGRRARAGALVGRSAIAPITKNPGERRDRPALGPALGAAVVERQQEQQDHTEHRHPDRRQPHQARRLDHTQKPNRKKKYHSGRGSRWWWWVAFDPSSAPEHQRHRMMPPSPRTPSWRPSAPRRGRTASLATSGSSTRGGTPPSRAVHLPRASASRHQLGLAQLGLLGFHPRRSRCAELRHQVQVGADRRREQAGNSSMWIA